MLRLGHKRCARPGWRRFCWVSTTELLVGESHHNLWISLTIGLMGLDELHLRVLASSSDDQREKRNAQKSG